MTRLLSDPFKLQLTYFKTFTLFIPDALVWGYFSILLYRETGSLTILFVERIIVMLAIYVGFVFTSFYLDKIGYLTTYRLALLLNALAILLIFVFQHNLAELFVIISLIYGFGRGLYWPVDRGTHTRNISIDRRSAFINKVTSIHLIISIVLPVLAGSLIQLEGNYNLLLIFGFLITSLSVFAPFKTNHTEITNLRTSEIRGIIRKKGFKLFAFSQSILGAFQTLHIAVFLILPFLFFRNELGVGLLVSAMGLVSAFASFAERNIAEKKKVFLGYVSHIIWLVLSILLFIFWDPVFLVFQAIASSFNIALGFSIRASEDYKIRADFLDKNLVESSAEMNVVIESVYFVARTIVLILVVFLLSSAFVDLELILRLLVPLSPALLLLGYHLIAKQAR